MNESRKPGYPLLRTLGSTAFTNPTPRFTSFPSRRTSAVIACSGFAPRIAAAD